MSVYKKQIGGSHYKDMKIQPSKFINDNKLLFAEGNAIKYICRHAAKGEVQDLEKASRIIPLNNHIDIMFCLFQILYFSFSCVSADIFNSISFCK